MLGSARYEVLGDVDVLGPQGLPVETHSQHVAIGHERLGADEDAPHTEDSGFGEQREHLHHLCALRGRSTGRQHAAEIGPLSLVGRGLRVGLSNLLHPGEQGGDSLPR